MVLVSSLVSPQVVSAIDSVEDIVLLNNNVETNPTVESILNKENALVSDNNKSDKIDSSKSTIDSEEINKFDDLENLNKFDDLENLNTKDNKSMVVDDEKSYITDNNLVNIKIEIGEPQKNENFYTLTNIELENVDNVLGFKIDIITDDLFMVDYILDGKELSTVNKTITFYKEYTSEQVKEILQNIKIYSYSNSNIDVKITLNDRGLSSTSPIESKILTLDGIPVPEVEYSQGSITLGDVVKEGNYYTFPDIEGQFPATYYHPKVIVEVGACNSTTRSFRLPFSLLPQTWATIGSMT